MRSIDPSTNQEAFKYAFTSAFHRHLVVLKDQLYHQWDTRRDAMDDDSQPSDSIATRDMIYELDCVIEFVVEAVLRDLVKKDFATESNLGRPSSSLCYNFPKILLGPNVDDYQIPPELTTSSLIDTATRKGTSSFSVDREEDLSSVFYTLLQNTLALPFFNGSGDSFNVVSYFAAAHLKVCCEENPHLFYRNEFLSGRVERVCGELEKHFSSDQVTVTDVYNVFVVMLKSHLEGALGRFVPSADTTSVINKLREQGNNLMTNSAYAQAIKVYTDAINLCDFDSNGHLSQLFVNRAIAFIGLTCFPEAIEDLNKAVKSDISFTPAWIQLAYAQLYMGHSLVALQCYSVALQCCTGATLPNGIPDDNSFKQDYIKNKIQSTLPQFVEQILKSVHLTEIRARQQRQSDTEINNTIIAIKRSLKQLSEEALEVDKQCFIYPPTSSEPSVFRQLAERANQNRPAMFNHEVSQGVIAGTDASEASERPGIGRHPMIAVETRLGTPRPEGEERPRPDLAGLDDLIQARRNQNGTGATGAGTGAGTTAGATAGATGRPGDNGRTGDSPAPGQPNVMRDVLRGLLPEGVSEGLSSIMTQGFGGVGGTGEFIITPNNVRHQPNRENNPNPTNNNQNDDVPEPDLD